MTAAPQLAVGQTWRRNRDGRLAKVVGITDNARGDVLALAYRYVDDNGTFTSPRRENLPYTFTRSHTLTDKETAT
jgi:hypothetical protein